MSSTASASSSARPCAQKGVQPHMLVMSATPIPRTLALTVYGDLDVSVIDEMPAGRTPVKTKWLTTDQRERAYAFHPAAGQPEDGRPSSSTRWWRSRSSARPGRPSRNTPASKRHDLPRSAGGPAARPDAGRRKGRVMRAFSAGESDILVATSVVEVGIDVPNATVIMIEGADASAWPSYTSSGAGSARGVPVLLHPDLRCGRGRGLATTAGAGDQHGRLCAGAD